MGPDRSLDPGSCVVVPKDLVCRIPDIARKEVSEPAPSDSEVLTDRNERCPVLEHEAVTVGRRDDAAAVGGTARRARADGCPVGQVAQMARGVPRADSDVIRG